MKLASLYDVFVHELQDLYDAEQQMTKAMPKIIQSVTSQNLKKEFENHFEETHMHIQRIGKICNELRIDPHGESSFGMRGLIQESDDIIKATGDEASKDAGLTVIVQYIEHYEIAGYGSAVAHADMLGFHKQAKLLQETLTEEESTDKQLTILAKEINKKAARNYHEQRYTHTGM